MKLLNEQTPLLKHKTVIRPRYGEVDQMGYVYHANYVSYCHIARTELLRTLGINDKMLEANNIMKPVIDMSLKYHHPAAYDDELEITSKVFELPKTRFTFYFEMHSGSTKICTAKSTVVFVDSQTRKPMRVPQLVLNALKKITP